MPPAHPLPQFLAFGDLFKLRIDLRQLGCVQAELGNAALVIDRHCGLVGDGSLDVVDGNVIAEDSPRVRVCRSIKAVRAARS